MKIDFNDEANFKRLNVLINKNLFDELSPFYSPDEVSACKWQLYPELDGTIPYTVEGGDEQLRSKVWNIIKRAIEDFQ